MSHFSQLKTNIKNKEILLNALKAMGYEAVEAEEGQKVDVRGFFGETEQAEIKIHAGGNYDIGFVRSGDSYELVGDWELLPRVADLTQDGFSKVLKREYAKESILEVAKKNHYRVEMNENEETHEIEMVVTKW